MTTTILITGSHGDLRVHKETGVILERTGCDCGECHSGYGDITIFNPSDIRREEHCGTIDILWVGYWDTEGRYEPATVHRQQWTERWGWDMDEPVALALLPSPDCNILSHPTRR